VLKKLAATGVVGFATAGVLMTSSPAFAGGDNVTSGDGGVLSGNQVIAPISIPIDVCGNAIAILGIAGAGCQGGASVGGGHGHGHHW
jgi:ChpA-C